MISSPRFVTHFFEFFYSTPCVFSASISILLHYLLSNIWFIVNLCKSDSFNAPIIFNASLSTCVCNNNMHNYFSEIIFSSKLCLNHTQLSFLNSDQISTLEWKLTLQKSCWSSRIDIETRWLNTYNPLIFLFCFSCLDWWNTPCFCSYLNVYQLMFHDLIVYCLQSFHCKHGRAYLFENV